MFTKATKLKAKLRMALIGVSGGGKTFTSLKIASSIGNKIAVIDTERGSASKYSDMFNFDVLELESFEPQKYIEAIQAAEKLGYDVIIIDSLSHAWNAKGGILEQHEKATLRQKTQNSYTAWRDVTPLHNELINTIIQSKIHIIATMRAKTEYVQERGENGKTSIKKVGLAPIQRDGMEYEFDIVADMDIDNNMIITKTRCFYLSGQIYKKPGDEVSKIINDWLSDGIDREKEIEDYLAKTLIQIDEQQTMDGVDKLCKEFKEKYGNDRIRLAKIVEAFKKKQQELNANEDVPQ